MSIQLYLFPVLFLFFLSNSQSFGQSDVNNLLRTRLEVQQPGENIQVQGISLSTLDEIHSFYTKRNFQELWSKDGRLTELAYELRYEIRNSTYDGLRPEDYNLAGIEAFFQIFESNKKANTGNSPGDLADVDLLLTDAFFNLASHLERGKVDPANFKEDWEITPKPRKANFQYLLTQSERKGEIKTQLESLYPDFTIYTTGREVIRDLHEKLKTNPIDWSPVKVNKAIRVGEKDKSIPVFRERLIYWDYLEEYAIEDEGIFDSTLFQGIKFFQQKNGMEPDGIIGKMTSSAINYSPQDLIDKASVNLERLRWLPDTVRNEEFILVNIANYQLDYLSNLDTLLSERVIVGKRYHESPIFTSEMSYIVFSPYWNIPVSITRGEIIPKVRKDPNYLVEKNMEVVNNSGKVIDPAGIDWSSKSFPYMIRQKPGNGNSLGLVKFIFPNQHSVYIHDTPARYLFAKEERAMSHGCIRIQNPEDFAAKLLRSDPSWTASRIDEAMHQSTEKIVHLKKKIPVVLLYLTFWADSKGDAHFREDVYGRDQEVLQALRE